MVAQPIVPDDRERLRAELESDLARNGVRPMTAKRLDAIAQHSPWASPEELETFLADVYEARGHD